METVPHVVSVGMRGRLPEHVHVARPELVHRRWNAHPHHRVRYHVRSTSNCEDATRAPEEHGGEGPGRQGL